MCFEVCCGCAQMPRTNAGLQAIARASRHSFFAETPAPRAFSEKARGKGAHFLLELGGSRIKRLKKSPSEKGYVVPHASRESPKHLVLPRSVPVGVHDSSKHYRCMGPFAQPLLSFTSSNPVVR